MKLYVVEAGHRDFEFVYGIFDSLTDAITAASAYKSAHFGGAVEDVHIFEVVAGEVLRRDEFDEYVHWPIVWSGQSS